MTRLDTRIHPTPLPRALSKMAFGGCAAVMAGIVLLCVSFLPLPATVPALTIVNPGAHQIHVDATGPGRQGGVGLGTVESGSTRVTEEVIDQGEEWVLHFSYAGVDAGELVVTRSQLQAQNWEVTIPLEVSERLRAEGIRPSTR